MGKKPHKTFDSQGKDDKVKKLQAALKEKDKRIRQLESEVNTLQAAFKKAANYMSKESKSLSVEELISAANKSQTLEQAIHENIPDEKTHKEREREEARQKWANWAKENRRGNSED